MSQKNKRTKMTGFKNSHRSSMVAGERKEQKPCRIVEVWDDSMNTLGNEPNKMTEEIGGSECPRKNTSWLSYRSFSKYVGPPFIATAIFAIFAQRNSHSFSTAKQKNKWYVKSLVVIVTIVFFMGGP